jgi:hypothetical protein
MSVQVKLRNGRIMDAVQVEDEMFEVELASGKINIYHISQLLAVVYEASHSEDNTLTKEESITMKKPIYHYLLQHKVGEDYVTMRFVTNVLPVAHAEDYLMSLSTRRASKDIMALTTGTYRFTLIEELLIEKDHDFTLMVISNSDLAKYDSNKVEEFCTRSVFAHANADYSFFLKVPGYSWGLDALGLTLDMKKKSAKRAQELYRLTELSKHFTATAYHPNIELLDMEDTNEILWDGMSYMRESLAVEIARSIPDRARRGRVIRDIKAGRMVRFTFRVMTCNGLIKGDVIVVPDGQIKGDITTHISNLKSELRTDGYMHITMWEHSTHHLAVWDDQSTINFGKAMPESKHMSDLHRLFTIAKNSLENGELPQFLLIGESKRDNDGVPDMGKLSADLSKQWIQWQLAGGDVRSLQNLVIMALGGLVNRMKTEIVYTQKTLGMNFHKKMWIPMTNAILAAVVTYESATQMGGFDFLDRDPDTVFFDDRVGMVIPGKRFIETFDAHGTWDLDDTAKFIWIKLWASGNIDHHRGVTIPADMFVPSNKEDAVDALLVVRSPNGPGEYSIEIPDLDGMFPDPDLVDLDQVVSVDMSVMPLTQEMLMSDVDVTGLPVSTVYSGTDVTLLDSISMIQAQINNPGVGRFCNAMMAWAAVKGPSFPKVMAEVMGNIVDTVQQGFDIAGFTAIAEESARIMETLITEMDADPKLRIDKAVLATRVNDPVYQEELIGRTREGRLTNVQKEYAVVINKIINELKNVSLQWRRETDLVKELRHISFGEDIKPWSQQFYSKFTGEMKLAEDRFKAEVNSKNPFISSQGLYMKKLAMEAVVADMVGVFMAMDESERYRHVVGFMKWINLADHGKAEALGKHDRLLCQPGAGMSVMHILIEGLRHYGLLLA